MTLLEPGTVFPELTLSRAGGGALNLPTDLRGHYGVILFYRGAWCPFCNAQLHAFQRASTDLEHADIQVVALSVDDEPTTTALIEKHHLRFPIGHSADADHVADLTGAFIDHHAKYLQSTGFVLDPTGRIVTSVYSSGAIGRLLPPDVIGLVRYHTDATATHDTH